MRERIFIRLLKIRSARRDNLWLYSLNLRSYFTRYGISEVFYMNHYMVKFLNGSWIMGATEHEVFEKIIEDLRDHK